MPKPKIDHAYEFLSRTLAGTKPKPSDIRELVKNRVKEDEHLDFKSGVEFVDEPEADKPGEPKKFHTKLRKFVAGFANSDGGTLVIGVAEAKVPGTDKIDPHGVRPIDGIKLSADEAVRRTREAVASLRPYLSRAPQVHPVKVGRRLVLVIAVERSDSLVICLEVNQTVTHYLRIGDKTTKAPGYLVEDLILGRRRRTSLVVSNVRGNLRDEASTICLDVSNTGLVWMDDVRAGLVGYERKPPAAKFGETPPILQNVDSRGIQGRSHDAEHFPSVLPFKIDHVDKTAPLPSSVGPLQSVQMSIYRELLRLNHGDIYAGAVFIVSRDQSPVWFQLVAHMEARELSKTIVILPLEGRRPIVQVAPREQIKWCEIIAVHGRSELAARWTDE